MSEAAYVRVMEYCDDLSERIKLKQEWQLRHPDRNSKQFQQDWENWYDNQEGEHDFKSSFDSNDPSPNTADVFTAEMLASIMLVALAAYEKAIHNG